jgi:hypothetical protein
MVKEVKGMIVKRTERQGRMFKGVNFLVGATGERMMVTLMTFKEGQEVDTTVIPMSRLVIASRAASC